MGFEKIAVRTLRQEVYDRLRDKIISAEILPGQTISLRELARNFGVSIMPVREALWQLESERIIVIESNKGIRVNTLTAAEMEEAIRLRILLESTAAERACDFRPEDAVPKLKNLLDSMGASVGRPKIYMRRNTQFHFAIYSYAESPLLLDMLNRLWARVFPYVFTYSILKQEKNEAMRHHRKMFEGFAERNKKVIKEALQEDLQSAGRLIIAGLAKSRPDSSGRRISSLITAS
ncbi:MAG TPA: GntR family transcriptional regulator [Thermodesulfobacteriota bacterium]|nr:GntR family transcriptional regulator [Thermodesulfobacteriota bacterium]